MVFRRRWAVDLTVSKARAGRPRGLRLRQQAGLPVRATVLGHFLTQIEMRP